MISYEDAVTSHEPYSRPRKPTIYKLRYLLNVRTCSVAVTVNTDHRSVAGRSQMLYVVLFTDKMHQNAFFMEIIRYRGGEPTACPSATALAENENKEVKS